MAPQRWKPTDKYLTATIEGIDCVVYLSEYDRPGRMRQYNLLAFGGRRQKPDLHYRYGSRERRDNAAQEYLDNRAEEAARKTKKKAERKAMAKVGNPLNVGDLLSYSWGYDQTNVYFYQVVRKTARSVWIQRVCSEQIEATGPMSAKVRACKDTFQKNSEPMRKLVQVYNGRPILDMPHGVASPCGTEPQYCSWYH
jgi:hypothetical protein